MAQRVEAGAVGQVEVDRRHRDPAGRDRRQVGPRLVVEARVRAVDPVAAAVLLLALELQLVAVDALAEARHLHALRLAGGHVDVQQRPRGQRHVLDALDEPRDEPAATSKPKPPSKR